MGLEGPPPSSHWRKPNSITQATSSVASSKLHLCQNDSSSPFVTIVESRVAVFNGEAIPSKGDIFGPATAQ